MTPTTSITAYLDSVKTLEKKAIKTHKGCNDYYCSTPGNSGCNNCGYGPEEHDPSAASRDTITRLRRALEHEMETSDKLTDWEMESFLNRRRAELLEILTSDKP